MVKVISELEKIGLSLTDEQKESIKKSMGEELYSKQELDKKLSKTQELEEKNKELVGKQETQKGITDYERCCTGCRCPEPEDHGTDYHIGKRA